jgi:hypothetical protein
MRDSSRTSTARRRSIAPIPIVWRDPTVTVAIAWSPKHAFARTLGAFALAKCDRTAAGTGRGTTSSVVGLQTVRSAPTQADADEPNTRQSVHNGKRRGQTADDLIGAANAPPT